MILKNKNLSNAFILLIALLFSVPSFSQTAPFEISLEPITISELGGLQSYAFGQDQGKWLIVGGRLDGLHRRQPWAAFDEAGHNIQLIVVDPLTSQKWSAPLTSLPTLIQEQLSSTNMEFFQDGDYLYCLGGYGYSPTQGDHTTFDKLTAIHVPNVIDAIVNNSSFVNEFRQITDAQFQVTGGRLQKINNTFYLLGGQKFIGRYNPMGPNHGPGFIQEYTNSVRKFNLSDNGTIIQITHLPSYSDSENLHRRDYNAEPQILPNGAEGITMFSGVFQENVDLPFLNSVTLDSLGYAVNNTFQQHYNHYHCPSLPLYSTENNEMHTVFFGGIAQFYDNAGTLVQDNDVPFVNTIARVTRDVNGAMAEYKLPIEMPALLGAGGAFIPNLNFPHFDNHVYDLDSVSTEPTIIGYIYGGISSSAPNIFFINDGNESSASSQIFKVFISTPTTVGMDQLNTSSISSLNFTCHPNPTTGVLNISFNLVIKEDAKLSIIDIDGNDVETIELKDTSIGQNRYTIKLGTPMTQAMYLLVIETSSDSAMQKIIMKD